MAPYTIFRAAFGYLFLLLIVRTAGRRPGRQLTPFEFVLIFYLGGLTLTGIVGDEASLTNAVCQILTVCACHYLLSWLRFRSNRMARVLDGVPLILLAGKQWHSAALDHTRIQVEDVMDMARNEGLKDLTEVEYAILETYGEISIVPVGDKKQ